jgi:hypothetical protein
MISYNAMRKIVREVNLTHRNAVARDLRTPKYRMRVVRNRKIYSRKAKQED